MKTAFLALLLVGLSLPLPAQDLKDPGFETPGQTLVSSSDTPNGKAQISGTVADGWQDNTNWADVGIVYSLDVDSPHGGKLSQKIEVTRGFAQFVQPVTLQAGHYRATVWLRAQPAQWAALSLRLADAPYSNFAYRPFKIGSEWTAVTVEGDTPAVGGYFMVNVAGTGTVWVDDAELTRSASPSAARTFFPPPGKIPRAYFGLNVNHMHDPPGFDWPALDFGAYRTWDSGVVWSSVEPQRGVYDWKNLDKDVAQAEKHHAQFLFTLGGSPRWAAPPGHDSYVGSSAPPTDIQDWKDFLTAVVTRYKGRIGAYEVWNEPDLEQFYSGTPVQLAALEKAAAEVIHAIDPAALVVAPPPSGGIGIGQLKWYDDYLSAGGGQSADVYALHSYTGVPEGDEDVIKTYRALLRDHHLPEKPMWNTETGLELANHTEEYAAAYLSREFITDWAVGLRRMYFYAYDNGLYYGLDKEDADGKNRAPATLAPSGIAYQNVMGWLSGSQMLSCGCDNAGTWTTALRRPDGSHAWIVWNANGSQMFPLPKSWKVKRRRDLQGSAVSVSGRTIPVSTSPVLLEAP